MTKRCSLKDEVEFLSFKKTEREILHEASLIALLWTAHRSWYIGLHTRVTWLLGQPFTYFSSYFEYDDIWKAMIFEGYFYHNFLPNWLPKKERKSSRTILHLFKNLTLSLKYGGSGLIHRTLFLSSKEILALKRLVICLVTNYQWRVAIKIFSCCRIAV